MANKREYIQSIQDAVSQVNNCPCEHLETVHVHEVLEGETVWEGDVAVFSLSGHPAQKVYAWMYEDRGKEYFAAVGGDPPIKTAQDAVRVHIAAKANGRGE